ncbi:MAG: M23 family metallopeptidase [Deltaproteobacteria bacterium]|nr:M23 family metallopeptidase [Deltaproteobacteria bacterium]
MPRRSLLIGLLVIIVLIPLLWLYIVRFEGEPPQVSWDLERNYLGRTQVVHLDVSDAKSGIRRVWVQMLRDGRQDKIYEESFPMMGWMDGGSVTHKSIDLTIEPTKLGITDGKVVLEAQVWDGSLNGWLHGNKTVLLKEVIVDTVLPAVSVLGNTQYLNQGGAGVVLYKISKEVVRQGVKVGDRLYPGYPVSGQPGLYEAYFGLPYETADVRLAVVAEDMAGNRTEAGFPHRIRKKHFQKDRLELSEGFLKDIEAKFTSRYPELASEGSPLKVFIHVNSKMRESNGREFLAACSSSSPERLWDGPFQSLTNAGVRAGFADHREYVFNNESVAESVHEGLDLASLAMASVPAANSGIVTEAKEIGIYGNTVILDHGMGLFSTYSHLSSIMVTPGQRVQKGQTLGLTGSTGLAGGDHLHFGIAIQGIFVNPIEWLDPNWVEKKIMEPIGAGRPAGAQPS